MRNLVLTLSVVLVLMITGGNAGDPDIRLTPLEYPGIDIPIYAIEFRKYSYSEWSAFHIHSNDLRNSEEKIANMICNQAGKAGPSYFVRIDMESIGAVFDNPIQKWYLLSSYKEGVNRIQDCYLYYPERYEELSTLFRHAVGVICNHTTDPQPFRLIGGANNREGVVYSFYDHSWGPVCAQYNHHLPNVVCKELGFSGRSQWATPDVFEIPHQTEPVVYYNGTCPNGADRLSNCSHVEAKIYGCWKLAVICEIAELDIRIVDKEGLVEVSLNDEWRPVCVDLTASDLPGYYSELVCKKLGQTNGSSHAIAVAPTPTYIASGDGHIRVKTYPRPWLDVAGCSENMTSLEECQTSPLGSAVDCYSREGFAYKYSREGFAYMGVACNDNDSLSVRLVEGDHPLEGIVEVYSESFDYWGGVLMYSDFNKDSQPKYSEIICRQLGVESNGTSYMIASEYFNASWSRDKLHDVWLHIQSCSGDEELIEDCRWKLPMGAYPDADDLNIGYVMLAVVCDPGPTPRPLLIAASNDITDHTAGRVEIYNGNGKWNRICAEESRYHLWAGSIADVMCRQMGFSSWSFLLTPGTFGRGSGQILMTSGSCTGKENSFDECFHDLIGRQPHMECHDITLACNVESPILLRLIEGSTPSEGILEVNFNGQAGRICNLDWDHNNTLVVCRQLGFPDGISYAIPEDTAATERLQPWRTWLQTVSCNGDEGSIADCPHSPWGWVDLKCTNDTPSVAVVCGAPIPEIRLSGTGFPNKGVVEIYFREEWGIICGDYKWTDTAATIVCRQLGYSGLAFATSQAAFDSNGVESDSFQDRRVWLQSIRCEGTEDALAQCQFKSWKFTNERSCSEGYFVAGVICSA